MNSNGAISTAPRRRRPGLLRWLFTRRNVVGAVVGAGGCAALGLGLPAQALGFCAARWLYSRAEQRVPFTSRLHIILLPGAAEALLGEHLYEAFLSDAATRARLLPVAHPDTSLVTAIAQRLVAALEKGHGGGHQRHLRHFGWQVCVVDQDVANAFVYPGGKIVVFTGLLSLLGRDPDLLAMVLGHEVGHALARHNSEKMGVGLAAGVALQMAAVALGAGGGGATQARHAERQRQVAAARQQRGYHRAYSRLLDAHPPAAPHQAQQQRGGLPPGACGAAAGSGGGGRYGYPDVPSPEVEAPPPSRYGYPDVPSPEVEAPPPGQLPRWMTEQLLSTLSRVLLELPFSRRAEAEADLIGLKLVALAGYDPSKAPEAFRRLAAAGGGKPGGAGARGGGGDALAALASLGCTHPDSNRRAQLLAQELQWMAANKARATQAVGTKTTYWAL